jgi:hypothetical protein
MIQYQSNNWNARELSYSKLADWDEIAKLVNINGV